MIWAVVRVDVKKGLVVWCSEEVLSNLGLHPVRRLSYPTESRDYQMTYWGAGLYPDLPVGGFVCVLARGGMGWWSGI